MSRIVMAVLVAVLTFGGVNVWADRQPMLSIDGWGTITDPDGDCRVTVEAAKVMIRVPGTPHDYAAELKQWNAPRILRSVNGDFIAEVKVLGSFDPEADSTIKGRKAYNGGGILLVADKDNHASLQRAAYWDGGRTRHYLNFEVRQDGKFKSGRFDIDIPDGDCWLRLERRGNMLHAMTGTDGVNWKSYEPLKIDLPTRLAVGVEVINSASKEFECKFEGYALYERKSSEDQDE